MNTVKNGAALKKELLKASKLFKGDFKVILKKLSFDAFRELMTRTAIDYGFARANWSRAIDTAPSETILTNKLKKRYPPQPMPSLRGIKAGSVIIFYNNTDYILTLEHGTPPKTRAQPMVEPTYQMLLTDAKRMVAELTRRKYDV